MRIVAPLDGSTAAAFCDNKVTNSRYTVWNFLFLNFYEQFRRPVNFYFLLVASLKFISIVAPVNPLSTLLPLALTFSLTAIKAARDDIKRHKQDAIYNKKERKVLNREAMTWETRTNRSIRVGDVILLREGEDIPCDVVVLAATNPIVYIRTDNLDGELDLKPRDVVAPQLSSDHTGGDDVPNAIAHQLLSVDDSCASIVGKLGQMRVTCSDPSPMINCFDGVAEFFFYRSPAAETVAANNSAPMRVSLSENNILPQSCVLKNTKAAICLAVYTGEDTKCCLNKRNPKVKWAQIDRDISKYAIFVFIFQISCGFLFGSVGYLMNKNVEKTYWYLPMTTGEDGLAFGIYTLRFFLLTTVFIPISFKFVTDMSKYYFALVIENDVAMHHDGEWCNVRNSSIVEDLGQVDYVLSDKTGTLTQNVMEFLFATINGERRCLAPVEAEEVQGSCGEHVLHFGRVLSLCNTVEVVYDDVSQEMTQSGLSTGCGAVGTMRYQAASPDEVALCNGCEKLNVRLVARDATTAAVEVNGIKEEWFVHYVFAFASEFKTMGVIVEEKSTNAIYYFVKGADDRILEMALDENSSTGGPQWGKGERMSSKAAILAEVEHYAVFGLRTLLVAEKRLTRNELDEFLEKVREAELSMNNRKEEIYKLRLEMENSVTILGVTAIEDKLQDHVPETIRSFLQAGIKVWMLTGDKVQTAEQIALTCSLCSPGDCVLRVLADKLDAFESWEGYMESLLQFSKGVMADVQYGDAAFPTGSSSDSAVGEKACAMGVMQKRNGSVTTETNESADVNPLSTGSSYVLVIEGGQVLERILTTPSLLKLLTELSENCVSVICARTTPKQKAAVTRLVRSRGFITLAVGDGGNDVAMIQEAQVGVGITGREGKQAARAADFSISRFSDLRSLVFVHGQLAYNRTAFVIKYSFYKSVLIGIIQLVHNIFHTHYSGGSFWDGFGLTLWNGLYSLPQTMLYCLDRKVPRRVLEQTPALYKVTRSGVDLGVCQFFGSFIFRGVFQSILAYFLVLSVHGTGFASPNDAGQSAKDVAFTLTYAILILLQVVTVLMESHTVTALNAIFIFGMPVVYVAANMIYSSLESFYYYGVWKKTTDIVSFLTCIAVVSALVVPVLGVLTLIKIWRPDPRDVMRSAELRRQANDPLAVEKQASVSRLSRCLWCVPEEPSTYVTVVLADDELTIRNANSV